ncbi:MAG TPA: HAD family phosphatase [Thermomicrobiales bacterium]|nr:HAD family phosphatase [Thermomicrobiales bacterium]
MAELKAVFLDHDGTLVDTEPYWIEAEILLPEQFGLTWTEEDSVACIGSPMPVTAQKMQDLGIPMTIEEIIEDLCSRVLAMIDEQGVPWLPGALDLFENLAAEGIPCAIVSNAWRSVVEKNISTLPEGTVQFILAGNEMVHPKPHPWSYAHAAEVLGVDPAGQVAIEDSLPGTLSAEAAGMNVLVVPGIAEVPDAPTRFRVGSLTNVSVDTLRAIAAGEFAPTVVS